MRRSLFLFFLAFIVLGAVLQSFSQLLPEELGEREKWEEFLRTAKVIDSKDIGQGVTRPKKLTLRKNDVEAFGVWKSPTGIGAGFIDKWEYEIAAYRMDKLLGLNMVPPTVERSFRGRKGSLQLWVTLARSELERVKQNIPVPADKTDHVERMVYLQRAFDSLIANFDRTLQNLCYTEDWRLILIDHSRSFISLGIYTEKLIYGKYGMNKEKRFLKLPREFVEKIRNLNFDTIRKAVGFTIAYTEINAILTRKKLLLKEIDELIEEKGEGEVLY